MVETQKQWVYVNISVEQIVEIDKLIAYARGRGMYQSRSQIVAKAIDEYLEKSENKEKIRSVSR